MPEMISRFTALPAYGIGARARTIRTGALDRNSTLALSLSTVVPLLGFALAMKANSLAMVSMIPNWFRHAVLPG
jgi:hypothetical protein